MPLDWVRELVSCSEVMSSPSQRQSHAPMLWHSHSHCKSFEIEQKRTHLKCTCHAQIQFPIRPAKWLSVRNACLPAFAATFSDPLVKKPSNFGWILEFLGFFGFGMFFWIYSSGETRTKYRTKNGFVFQIDKNHNKELPSMRFHFTFVIRSLPFDSAQFPM